MVDENVTNDNGVVKPIVEDVEKIDDTKKAIEVVVDNQEAIAEATKQNAENQKFTLEYACNMLEGIVNRLSSLESKMTEKEPEIVVEETMNAPITKEEVKQEEKEEKEEKEEAKEDKNEKPLEKKRRRFFI